MTDEPEVEPADEPSAADRAAVRRAGLYPPPPRALEERVVKELRMQGLLREDRNRWRRWQPAAIVLATAAVLAVGIWIGTLAGRNGPTAAGQPRFMLLLYEDAEFQAGGPDEARARVVEYTAWARSLASDGRLVAGEELGASGQVLRSRGRRERLPEAALAAEPRGYFMITARDEASALDIAATCPHLVHGGRVVVMPVVN